VARNPAKKGKQKKKTANNHFRGGNLPGEAAVYKGFVNQTLKRKQKIGEYEKKKEDTSLNGDKGQKIFQKPNKKKKKGAAAFQRASAQSGALALNED